MTPRHASTLVCAVLAVLALTACDPGHGKHTQALADESAENLRGIKSAAAFDAANQRFRAGDFEEALKLVRQSTALNPNVADAYLLEARILIEVGQPRKAFGAIERGRAIAPDDARFPYYLGTVYESVGQSEEALEQYKLAAGMDTGSPQYGLAASEMLIEMGRLDEAEAYVKQQIETFTFTAGLYQTRGHVALMREDHDLAVEMFASAVTLDPDEMSLREDLSRMLVIVGRYAEAELQLRRILEHRAYAARRDLRHLHVRCLLEIDQPVEARTILRQLIRDKNGRDYEAWTRMVDVALILNDDAVLRDAASRMMALQPKRPDGYLALALWQHRQGDPAGAKRALQRCGEFAPDDPAVRQFLRMIELEQTAVSNAGA